MDSESGALERDFVGEEEDIEDVEEEVVGMEVDVVTAAEDVEEIEEIEEEEEEREEGGGDFMEGSVEKRREEWNGEEVEVESIQQKKKMKKK